MKAVFLLAALVLPLSARIGDNRAQLVARYGTPMLDNDTAPEFKKSGMMIHTKLINDNCQFISLINGLKPGTSEPLAFSGPQIAALIEASAPGRKWQKDNGGFKTQDGSLSANTSSPGVVTIQTSEFLAANPPSAGELAKTDDTPQPPKIRPGRPPTRVEIDAQTSSAGASRDKKWETYWGSYDRDIYRERLVSISMRASTGGPATIEVHWIGSEVGQPGGNKVVDLTKQEITLPAANPVVVELGSLFVESDTKYAALGVRDRKGIKYAGWVARVVDQQGNVLAVQGSRPPLIELVK